MCSLGASAPGTNAGPRITDNFVPRAPEGGDILLGLISRPDCVAPIQGLEKRPARGSVPGVYTPGYMLSPRFGGSGNQGRRPYQFQPGEPQSDTRPNQLPLNLALPMRRSAEKEPVRIEPGPRPLTSQTASFQTFHHERPIFFSSCLRKPSSSGETNRPACFSPFSTSYARRHHSSAASGRSDPSAIRAIRQYETQRPRA